MIRSQLSKDEQGKHVKQTELRLRVRREKELDGFKKNTIYCGWASDKDERGVR